MTAIGVNETIFFTNFSNCGEGDRTSICCLVTTKASADLHSWGLLEVPQVTGGVGRHRVGGSAPYDDWINWVLFESFDDHEVILEIHWNTSKMDVDYIVGFHDAR